MDTLQQYRKWFEYEKETHQRVFDSLKTVPSSKQKSEDYQKAIDLFSHILAARKFWLYRIGVLQNIRKDLFESSIDIDRLIGLMVEVHQMWDKYFEKLDEEEVARTFEYRSTGGRRYSNRVEDILAQLFGHSWYHRGQIALIVRTLGGTPAKTDNVFWTRKLQN
jgi:uncharacterized damage-inducible protein DinB